MKGKQTHFLPRLSDLGEKALESSRGGVKIQPIRGNEAEQGRADAVIKRISGRQHNGPPSAVQQFGKPGHDFAVDGNFFRRTGNLRQFEKTRRRDHQFRLPEPFFRSAGKTIVPADHIYDFTIHDQIPRLLKS